MMKRKTLLSLFASLVVAFTAVGSVAAQDPSPTMPVTGASVVGTPVGSAITYQGQLKQNGNPANGNFDFQFILYDAASGGNQQGVTLQLSNIAVTNGLFNVQLDFGQAVFNGEARTLEVGVKPVGSTEPYTVLSPRTTLSAVPYALGMPGLTIKDGTVTVPGWLQADHFAMSGTDFRMLPNARGNGGLALVHDANNTLVLNFGQEFTGGTRVDGWLQADHFAMAGTDFRMLPNARGNGGLALVHDANNTLVLNFGQEFTGGTRVDGWLQADHLAMAGTDFRMLPNARGNGGLALVHDADNTLVLNFGREFTGGTRVDGLLKTNALQITGGSDLAELFSQADNAPVEPGTVMVIDPEHAGKLMTSTIAYDRKVAGIVSGAGDVNPGLTLQQEGVLDGNLSIAMVGRVYVKAEAESGVIEPGDLLTTSDMAGYAMKASDDERSQGAVIGKAMTGLQDGTGLVLVLVNLQ